MDFLEKKKTYGIPKKKERKKKNPMEFLQKKRKSFRIFLLWCYSTP